ncbi:MAG: hypothetical protein WD049_00025 [Candidatus Paceibacterota bacterium]
MTTTTKKMLVAVDMGRITMRKGDFVLPSQDESDAEVFTAIDGTGVATFACVSYTGRDLDANTLFARYVESGAKIANVENLVAELDDYLRQIKMFKVGNVVGIRSDGESRTLYLAQKRPPDGAI